MVQGIYFLGLFLREASRNEDCNAVPELESHNLYLFFQAVQIKNQTVRWVVRPLNPEAVFPKENESGEKKVIVISTLCLCLSCCLLLV